jgi:two-component system response regulator GlrR
MSEYQYTPPKAANTNESRTRSQNTTGADESSSSVVSSNQGRATGRFGGDRIISVSAKMQAVVDQASAVARGEGLVVIAGQSGSGRKHVARSIHQWSARAGIPLVEVQIAGTSEQTQSRELFGDASTPGALARGQGGSVLIERADQLSPDVLTRMSDDLRAASGSRPRLLATIADGAQGALAPLGGGEPWLPSVDHIQIAPLEARSEDILPLAAHFLAEFAAAEGIEPIGFTNDARRWLVEETWPENVRELRERIRHSLRLAGNGAVSAETLMFADEGEDEDVPSFKDAKRAFETRYVEGLLRRCSGNISRAARMAKKDRKDFYDVIRRTSVDPGQFRGN